MAAATTIFDTQHNDAFKALGALEPGRQWSAFDVPRDKARKGKATVFVTTIWNFHSTLDEKGHRTPTERAIGQDITDGTYWYRISKPPTDATRKTWVAHWNGLELAIEKHIPIVGALKDVHTNLCSLKHVFDCVGARGEADGNAIWIELSPRGEVGCEVRQINISQVTVNQLPFFEQHAAKAERNPVWSRDELILALDLYIRHRLSPPGKGSTEVLELSEFLSVMGRALGVRDAATYRNANGVYMKMMNFRRFDPQYTDSGKVGLTRGNKDEAVVWSEFANEPPRLASVVAAIRSAVTQHADDDDLGGADEPEIQEAEEGRVLTRLHRVRERSRKLVEQCKKAALKKHGRLYCAACGFDFATKYGPTGDGLIDVHHTKPVHTLAAGDKTNLADLVLLCANCHRVVHSTRRWLSVDQVRLFVQSASS